jgi:hypothetical protein
VIFAVGALAAPNFSGDWKMNVAKSEFGPIPPPEILTRTIKHQDPVLQYWTHQKGAQGAVTTELKYTTDGKECVNQVNGSEAKGTAKWEGDHLVIESEREVQGVHLTARETWMLSADGKTLTIQNHISVPQQGEFDVKLVLEKQ